jgi:hypothetical protein
VTWLPRKPTAGGAGRIFTVAWHVKRAWRLCDGEEAKKLIGAILFDDKAAFKCYESNDLVKYNNWIVAGRRHLTLIEYDVQPILKNYHVVDVRFTKSKSIELLIANPFDIDFVKRIIAIGDVINGYPNMYAYEINVFTDRYELDVYANRNPRSIDFDKNSRWVEVYAPLPKQVCDKIREVFGSAEIRFGYGGSCA